MNPYEQKLVKFVEENMIEGEHLIFEVSCHTVDEAAKAATAKREDFVKSICMIDNENNLIVAIVKGEDRASTSRVGKALGIERPRAATPDEILDRTGYPCGGTPGFGYAARFLIDPNVFEKDFVLTGGGSENSLLKISPSALKRANNGEVVRIRK